MALQLFLHGSWSWQTGRPTDKWTTRILSSCYMSLLPVAAALTLTRTLTLTSKIYSNSSLVHVPQIWRKSTHNYLVILFIQTSGYKRQSKQYLLPHWQRHKLICQSTTVTSQTKDDAFLMRQLIVAWRLGRTEYQLLLMKILWWDRNVKIRYKCFGCDWWIFNCNKQRMMIKVKWWWKSIRKGRIWPLSPPKSLTDHLQNLHTR